MTNRLGLQAKLIGVFNIERLSKFSLVGILAAIIYYIELLVMVELFNVAVLIATSIAFILITIQNYTLHYSWTFQSTNAHFVAFPRFLWMNIVGFWINWTVMYIGVNGWELNYLLVQAVAIGFVVTWNFVVLHFWIFNES